MFQNIYSLSDLIDLALTVPEVGAVNFCILHTVLHAIVNELQISDVHPWCQIRDPLLEETDVIKAKLNVAALQRTSSPKPSEEREAQIRSRTEENVSQTKKDRPLSADKKDDVQKVESKSIQTSEPKNSDPQPSVQKEKHPVTETKDKMTQESQQPSTPKKDSAVQVHITTDERAKGTTLPSEPKKSAQQPSVQKLKHPLDETKDKMTEESQQPSTPKKDSAVQVHITRDERAKSTTTSDDSHKEKEDKEMEGSSTSFTKEEDKEKEDNEMEGSWTSFIDEETKPENERISTRDILNYRELKTRIEAVEESVDRLSNLVDMVLDKLKKAEQKKKGAPLSDELEAMDERLTELEELMAKLSSDHELLMELKRKLDAMIEEFEAIKALGSQLKQMQIDISLKADKEETWAALALKGDLELVNTKVDRLEFETAIEELGEAIGLLGIKFTKKNEEWEERAAAIWRGIDSKMSRDIFEAARVKFESRITALMYALRKIKKVVEELLYPEASGVTRCILCRRPACIPGQECLGISESPKRPLSDKNSGDDDADRLRRTLDDAIAKKQKLEAPPYCESSETIIKLPYSSFPYQREAAKESSQVPKLPDIKEKDSKLTKKKIMVRPKAKPRAQKEELVFTKKLLAELERKKDYLQPKSVKYTAVIETEPRKKKVSRPSSARSSVSSTHMEQTPEKALQSFAPARLMPDAFRRNILLSPSQKQSRPNLSLSPLRFDPDSRNSVLNSKLIDREDIDSLTPSVTSITNSEISSTRSISSR